MRKFIEKNYIKIIKMLILGYSLLFAICCYMGKEMENGSGKFYINFLLLVLGLISDTCSIGNIITTYKKTKKMKKNLKDFLDEAGKTGYKKLTKNNIVNIVTRDNSVIEHIEKLRCFLVLLKIIICALLSYFFYKIDRIEDYQSFFINLYTYMIFIELFIQELFNYKYEKLLDKILENKFDKE